ncbi:MAG: 2,3-bisphosphoglycerate-independent phosphoglycerate mutase, partial [Acutalibacteraceae bacterium]|nr:2,3-bisphosphoglycerate-independent phosphoglycerate mutase [Acutalibacteraceae bacterium]
MKKPVVLCIMDGFGIRETKDGNAILNAATPNLTKLFRENPFTTIGASGLDVGLPDGQMGNSEVGHTNIGAGRVVYQMLVKISKSIKDGDFFNINAMKEAMENCVKNGTALHTIGLLSDGGVHSHIEHLYGILEMAKKYGLTKVYVHALLDGRDVSTTSGAGFIRDLENKMAELGVGKVASVMGRYYAMDRDFAWDRVEKAYAAMVYGEGVQASDAAKAVEDSYAKDVTDEFVLPTVINKDGMIKSGDSVISFNFRPDRARQFTRAFVDEAFDGFERKNGYMPLTYVCMTQYDETMPNVSVAFPPEELKMTFGEYLASKNMTQLRIAETQKYAHVTFFFNGGEEKTFEGEDRILIQSPDVPTFDLMPEMSAYPVCDAVCEQILSGKYDAVILNFANCDMVGHTGIFDAAVKAVEAVDTCVGRVVKATKEMGGVVFITADHGNADCMVGEDGNPFTPHTTNPVPFCVVGYDCKLKEGGRLADIIPSMLTVLGLEKPAEMDGESLII